MDEEKKHIDESWKETVEKEKSGADKEDKIQEKAIPQEPDFNFFITTLAIQASIFLGDMPNPATNKKEIDLPQAKFIIDTLSMLKEKTKGNLNQDENTLIENVLYELRMHYVTVLKGGQK